MKHIDPKRRAELMAIKLKEQRIRRTKLEIEELMLQFDGVFPQGFQDHYGTAKVTPLALFRRYSQREIFPDAEFFHDGFFDDRPECVGFKSLWFEHLDGGRIFLVCNYRNEVDSWLWITCFRGVVQLAALRGHFTLVNPSNGKGILFRNAEEKLRVYKFQL